MQKKIELDNVVLIDANDDDFGAIVNCAVRYCLGRRTYMPQLVTDWIKGHCTGKLNTRTLSVILNDINYQRHNGSLGDTCDITTWLKFEAWVQDEYNRRVNDGTKH